MNYLTRHRPEWEELEGLVRQANRRMHCLNATEISRLDVLYRQVCVQLAQVATRTRDASLIRYLNDLTAAAHSVIYRPARKSARQSAWAFVRDGFAMAVMRAWRCQFLSLLLLLSGFALGYVAVQQDPMAAYALMPAGEFRQPGATRQQLMESLQAGRGMGGGEKFIFATFLFSHNLKVSLLALATGVLAAIPTSMLITYNGMLLGAFTMVHHGQGIYLDYWAWILPHGLSELLSVVLCGGIGLRLGQAVVCPGRLSRGASLLEAGREASRIAIGVAMMLCFAAAVESFLRQSSLGNGERLLFAAGTLLFWVCYFWRGWRLNSAEREQSAV